MARAMKNLRRELAIMKTHREGVKKAAVYGNRRNLKLNFGCGPNYKPRWVNIDIVEGADLQLDMREAIPLPTGSAEIIYSEHFLEHLEYPVDAMHFLAECFRLLQSGGVISTGVPDTAWPLQSYSGLGDGRYLEACTANAWHPDWCQTPLEHINYHFRQGDEHKFAYDFETLQAALVKSGFISITQRDFDPSLDSESRRTGTLYVDAIRP